MTNIKQLTKSKKVQMLSCECKALVGSTIVKTINQKFNTVTSVVCFKHSK